MEEKISKELAVVDGYQSFWACSKGKRGYSGCTTYTSAAWSPVQCWIDPLCETDTDDLTDASNNDNNNEKEDGQRTKGTSLNTEPGTSNRQLNEEGRLVVTDHGSFILLNVYVPNAPSADSLQFKLKFLRALHRYCSKLNAQGREILLCGDLNLAAAQVDIHSCYGSIEEFYSPEERAVMAQLTTEYCDVWRKLHPDKKDVFTCWDQKTSARPFNQGVRIDYVLATPGIAARIKSCEILSADDIPPAWSDHAAMLIELDQEVQPPPEHAPCLEWTKLLGRFQDNKQRTLLSMFGGDGKGGQGVSKRLSGGPTEATQVKEASPPAKKAKTEAEAEKKDTQGEGGKNKKSIASFFNAPQPKKK